MQLKLKSLVSTQLHVLIMLEFHPTFVTTEFWVSSESRDCCWTPQLLGKSRNLSSELICAIFCAQKNCDSYNFDNGLCEVSKISSKETDGVFYKFRTKKNETREVARNKPTQSTPSCEDKTENFAVDGNTSTMYHSAKETPQPWILVDLQNNFLVSKIRLQLFTDYSVARRTVDTQVLLGAGPPPTDGDFSQYSEVGFIETALGSRLSWQEYEVSPPLCSRYVVVTKKVAHSYDKNIIQLNELEVFATF
ncbi:Coagulation factor 5/8 C-terminal domain [Trinorchestia longiramus]|nr:Coagulation factor 5/8 C-terminal domain [Trinorchestia longiramus]